MGLQDYDWDGYYPGDRNPLQEVFIPAFKRSTKYDRVTGDFSSSVLSVFAEGLQTFLSNGGSIRILAGQELFREDIEAIRRGELESEVVEGAISWEKLRDGIREEILEALAWLIDEGHLTFKIGIVVNEDGRMQPRALAEWHQKVAIFTDSDGKSISMVGSPNESFKAMVQNRESLSLTRSWITNDGVEWDEERRVEEHRNEFNQLWDNNANGSAVFDFPEALERELIEEKKPAQEPNWDRIIAIAEAEEVPLLADWPEGINPRRYQERAIRRFKANGNNLVVEHATGTGKTWTALFSAREIATSDDLIIVLTPTTDLVRQWDSNQNIRRFFPSARAIRCSGNNPGWKKQLHRALVSNREEPVLAISTMHPVTLNNLFDIATADTDPSERILIADEAHNIGAPKRREVLDSFPADRGRIALSATPDRDDEGDDFFDSYFGTERDTIGLGEAINDYKVLSEYDYSLHVVSLSSIERERYQEHTNEIVHLHNRYKSYDGQPVQETASRHQDLETEIYQRRNVVKECREKEEVTSKIIDDVGDRTLVFCNDKDHARKVRDSISEHSQRAAILFFGEFSQNSRETVISDFENGVIDTIVAIDVLTEGIDIPGCDSGILISNSLSEREGIQRCGRVLRKTEDVDQAEIHDFITLPVPFSEFKTGEADLSPGEITMVKRQITRIDQLKEHAISPLQATTKLFEIEGAVNAYRVNDD